MHCIFCRFALGQGQQHANGLPFLILRETTDTLTFLSAYQPKTTAGHILVIPKKHSHYLEEIEEKARHVLIDEIVFISALVRSLHPASNILLNNGREAGQHEPHVHFHVIPREIDDHLVVDSEPGSPLSEAEFFSLHQQYSKLLNSVLS